ncbi:hypothetical protein Cadr_000020781 [Camelus dromedarius]|uniref:Uncharacterized protein n=1 Tax=Camelus dromedarius TaxID=9838 RepID=A0A5N4CZ75_CAMDR|nr:hypothetical protein Cadr_000020781 [Camelus dromedarius]
MNSSVKRGVSTGPAHRPRPLALLSNHGGALPGLITRAWAPPTAEGFQQRSGRTSLHTRRSSDGPAEPRRVRWAPLGPRPLGLLSLEGSPGSGAETPGPQSRLQRRQQRGHQVRSAALAGRGQPPDGPFLPPLLPPPPSLGEGEPPRLARGTPTSRPLPPVLGPAPAGSSLKTAEHIGAPHSELPGTASPIRQPGSCPASWGRSSRPAHGRLTGSSLGQVPHGGETFQTLLRHGPRSRCVNLLLLSLLTLRLSPASGGRPWQEGRPDAEDGAPVGAASPAQPGRAPKPFAYVKPMRRETSTSVEPARPAQRGRGRHRGSSQRTGRGGGRGTGPHPHVELDNRDEPGHPVEPEARRTPSLPLTQAAGQGYRLQGPGPLGDLLGVRHQGLPNAYGHLSLCWVCTLGLSLDSHANALWHLPVRSATALRPLLSASLSLTWAFPFLSLPPPPPKAEPPLVLSRLSLQAPPRIPAGPRSAPTGWTGLRDKSVNWICRSQGANAVLRQGEQTLGNTGEKHESCAGMRVTCVDGTGKNRQGRQSLPGIDIPSKPRGHALSSPSTRPNLEFCSQSAHRRGWGEHRGAAQGPETQSHGT